METSEDLMLCDIINRFGDGQHPVAVPQSLPYFKRGYVNKCIDRAINHLNSIKKK